MIFSAEGCDLRIAYRRLFAHEDRTGVMRDQRSHARRHRGVHARDFTLAEFLRDKFGSDRDPASTPMLRRYATRKVVRRTRLSRVSRICARWARQRYIEEGLEAHRPCGATQDVCAAAAARVIVVRGKNRDPAPSEPQR